MRQAPVMRRERILPFSETKRRKTAAFLKSTSSTFSLQNWQKRRLPWPGAPPFGFFSRRFGLADDIANLSQRRRGPSRSF